MSENGGVDVTPEPRESEHFRLLVQAVKDYAIFMLDPEGRVVTWNAGAEAFKGYTSNEVLDKHCSLFYSAEDRDGGRPERDLQIAKRVGRFESEGWRVRKNGTKFWANVIIVAIRDGAGILIGFAKVTRDLTVQRKAQELEEIDVRRAKEGLEEENRRIQEATRLKTEFLANMSHELRTPLTAIVGFAELMSKGSAGPVSAAQKEYLGDILKSSAHLLKLINDVLDLAKVESGQMEFRPVPVDMGAVVAEVCDVLRGLASSKRIRTEAKVDASVAAAVLDPLKLKQVLYNYISNALKFTPEEGLVRVRAVPEGESRVGIEVEDSGIGIRPEDAQRLFVEFQQLDEGAAKEYAGTGLGLALTKRIVEAQGGRVGVRSEPGKGSTFWAVLPRRPCDFPVVSTAEPSRTPPTRAAVAETALVTDGPAAFLPITDGQWQDVDTRLKGFWSWTTTRHT